MDLETLIKKLAGWFLPWTPENVGAWMPIFKGTTTAGTFTYTAARYGSWTRFGNIIHVFGRATISAIGTAPTGLITLDGLPFTCDTTDGTSYGTLNFGYISNFKFAASGNVGQLSAYIQPGTTTAYLVEANYNAAPTNTPAANFVNAACDLVFSGQYRVS